MVDSNTNHVPLVVDLDGTLIRTDMMWESLARLLRRNPLALFMVLFWWCRGRAYLKSQLVKRVQVDPATLPYNESFVAFLREQKKMGRKLVLATASDRKMAEPIASYTGLFDEVLGSDGKINLRSENKLRVLKEKFGERGFDYAGNSTADYAVWQGSREAVVVNASARVLREAAKCTRLGPTFCQGFSAIATARRVVTELLWRSGYFTAIAAGILLASSFPGLNIAGFAWVAPALVLLAINNQSKGDAARTGYVAGLTFWLATLYWLLYMPATGLPILGWLALSAFLALYFSLWACLMSGTIDHCTTWLQRFLWTIGGAAAWVGIEFIRSHFLTGFPWSLLGVSQYKIIPLIQIAAFTGVWGVSFLVAWFSLAIFSAGRMILRHPTQRYVWQAEIVLPLTAIIFLYVFGMFRQGHQIEPATTLRVAMVQPSFPQTSIWDPAEDQRRFAALLAQTDRAIISNKVDMVIWPESAVPNVDLPTFDAISEFARVHEISILLNAEDDTITSTETNSFNAAFLIDATGRWQLPGYHKRKLVMFGEYIPLVKWIPFAKYFTTITSAWTPGTNGGHFKIKIPNESEGELKHLTINGSADNPIPNVVVTAPLICFEDSFPELARDRHPDELDFLVNVTNDGWFGNSAEQWQHAADSIFRAVENGVSLLRCANNGVTCWIDPHGRVQDVLVDKKNDVHPAGTLIIDLPIYAEHASTFYQKHGDWFAWTCLAVTGLFFLRHRRMIT